jgi:hypothetical protein
MDPNAAFDLFDADKDGRITREELLKAMETIGMRPTDEQLRRLIDGADSSGNGFVSRQDFVNLISRSQPIVRQGGCRGRFSRNPPAFDLANHWLDNRNTGVAQFWSSE